MAIQAVKKGHFGAYGGSYVSELLIQPLQELEEARQNILASDSFQKELGEILRNYAGRATPLTEAKRLSAYLEGPRIFLKREDLLHTGAHKLNNAIGQCLLAKKMGKTRIIAETGAGQHGVACATACAYLGLECVVYMGSVDALRQEPNVKRMQLLGAEVRSVDNGSCTLKDAVNEALRDWAASFEDTHYCIGSALGPHPFPTIVKEFQSVIGNELREQCLERFDRLPDCIVACIGGGSNAIGCFAPFVEEKEVELIGVEAGGKGKELGEHAARFQGGCPGVLHGAYSYLLQDKNGQVQETHSVSAGLDYPSVGPEHAYLHDSGRAQYRSVNDQEAVEAMQILSKLEGIIPALESSHALAYVLREYRNCAQDKILVINLSGRGDKDLPQLFDHLLKGDKGV
ncbi:MAG: tryptophan synthase subunit beta [Waddliaceae bacterium]|nr:tryptophan synthase subunit beta [Waddliaceae bacterium]